MTPLHFTASSTDPSGSTLTYNWDFGDSNTATGESVTPLTLLKVTIRLQLLFQTLIPIPRVLLYH